MAGRDPQVDTYIIISSFVCYFINLPIYFVFDYIYIFIYLLYLYTGTNIDISSAFKLCNLEGKHPILEMKVTDFFRRFG